MPGIFFRSSVDKYRSMLRKERAGVARCDALLNTAVTAAHLRFGMNVKDLVRAVARDVGLPGHPTMFAR
jgi:hypothetical protein